MSIARRGVALLTGIRLRISPAASPQVLSVRGTAGGRFPKDHSPTGHLTVPGGASPRSARDTGREPDTGGPSAAGRRWVLAVVAVAWIGLSVGIAVMGAVVAAQWPGDLARPTGAAFTDGIADSLLINAAIAAAAAVLVIAAIRTTPTPHDDRAAASAAQRQEGVERR